MLHEGIVFEQAEIICDDPALLSASAVSHSQISIEKTHESH
jgi:hypothetical protein